ncbi:MAG: hypothetical protein ACC618_02015 [Patescibacteria group bacterium]
MHKDSSQKLGFYVWKKIAFIAVFFIIAPVALFTSFLSLTTFSEKNSKDSVLGTSTPSQPVYQSGIQVFASLPSQLPSISGEVKAADARVGLLKSYLSERNSPLAYSAEFIVETSERYGLDYRLTTAIAQKESGLCKVIPEASNNCWGWGIHSKGVIKFDTFEDGIETVSQGLKEFYIDQGYITVEDIMVKYANPSSTTWAEGVIRYMNQIE